VVGDGMDRKATHLNRGDLPGDKGGVHVWEGADRRTGHAGVRALVVARKRRNGRGAKGGREVDV
jgi:hypothetical protein